jgi:transcriptional/translational regulatory protein YebC/TACO1
VAFQFSQKGIIVVSTEDATEDQIMEIALEAGADDVDSSDVIHEITTAPEALETVKEALEQAEIKTQSADLAMVAANNIMLDLSVARKVMRLIDNLEDQDDVDAVYSNSDIPEDVLAELSR